MCAFHDFENAVVLAHRLVVLHFVYSEPVGRGKGVARFVIVNHQLVVRHCAAHEVVSHELVNGVVGAGEVVARGAGVVSLACLLHLFHYLAPVYDVAVFALYGNAPAVAQQRIGLDESRISEIPVLRIIAQVGRSLPHFGFAECYVLFVAVVGHAVAPRRKEEQATEYLQIVLACYKVGQCTGIWHYNPVYHVHPPVAGLVVGGYYL